LDKHNIKNTKPSNYHKTCYIIYFYYLGVAFEQGTLLSTPENVPFRLSRDIVDGMGICGIEGTFRKYIK